MSGDSKALTPVVLPGTETLKCRASFRPWTELLMEAESPRH